MKKKLANFDWLYFIISLILIVLNIFVTRLFIRSGAIVINHKILFNVVIVIISIIFFAIISCLHYRKIKLENIFLLLFIPLGILYMLAIPIGRVPDEQNHFFRTLEITKGFLVTPTNSEGLTGNYFPSSYNIIFDKNAMNYRGIKENIMKKENKEQAFFQFNNTSLYAFLCYLPQTIGVFIGNIFKAPMLVKAYLGRITNFIICTILLYLAIKKLPIKKCTIFLIMFLPIIFQEFCSLSPDALTIAVSLLLVSYTLELVYNKHKLIKQNYYILTLLAVVLSLCKIVYLPLCLVIFLIPKDKFLHNNKEKILKLGTIFLIGLIINLVWLCISKKYLVETNVGVDAALQIKFILMHPFTYILNIFNSLYIYSQFYLHGLIGTTLCWFDVSTSDFYFNIMFILFIISIFGSDSKMDNINNKIKIWVGMLVLMVIILIYTSLYVQWTPVGNGFVDGVQGRYFIPILLPLALLSTFKNIKINLNNIYKYILLVYVGCNIYTLLTLFVSHI